MSFLIYGAYGYTGTLIARRAVETGRDPVLAGRDERRLMALANELGLEARAVALDAPPALDEALQDVSVVLHCAGPFIHTAQPMLEACLRTGTHYLDITGEIGVFEQLAQSDARGQAAGVMVLPGVGFDVVPTDCLAMHLHERLPEATQLELAIWGRGRSSQGTMHTVVEQIDMGGAIRRNGQLLQVPGGWRTRTVDFGEGPMAVVSIPWGDVATAYRSTGLPHITTYARLPKNARRLMRLSESASGVLASGPVQRLLKYRIAQGPPGPSAAERAEGASFVWAEVLADNGTRAAARLHGPETYTFTAATALAAAERVLDDTAPPGYQTPATAFGADFVLSVDGVTRSDLA